MKLKLQEKGMLEEDEVVPSIDSNVGLDKYGNPICPQIE